MRGRKLGSVVVLSLSAVVVFKSLGAASPAKRIEPELRRAVAETKTYQNSSLNKNCAQTGFACGECETTLQDGFNELLSKLTDGKIPAHGRWGELSRSSYIEIDPRVSLEEFLSQITDLMRRTNRQAPGHLNYLIVGKSESLQKTTPGHPRVLLKSPDSELWVTFNTDPKAPGYDSLEVMRWDGKEGRYQFQEITFLGKNPVGPLARPHIDLSGERCVQCHRSHLRPNWDTYRAWAGVIPPRDDYAEAEPKPDSAYGYRPAKEPRFDGNALAYFNFLEQIASAKESAASDRLKVLDIQYFEQDGLTDRQKIQQIRKQVLAKGFYRIPHFPDTALNGNYSTKTADKAGPSHLAFDQLMGQQLCQVATELKRDARFEQFKYAVAGLIYCDRNRADASTLKEYLPDWMMARADGYFRGSGLAIGNGESVVDAVFDDTKNNHAQRDDHKIRRHEEFLKSYLTEVERWNEEDATKEASYLASSASIGVSTPFSAIADPGGVKGVAESDTASIAALRYLLEPMDVKVSEWSMTLAESVADSSYAFSDQLIDILKEQPALREIYDEASTQGDACSKLPGLSKAAFGLPRVPFVPFSEIWKRIGNTAQDWKNSCLRLEAQAQPELGIPADKRPLGEKLLTACLDCHSGRADRQKGSRPWFNIPYREGDLATLKAWLNSPSIFRDGRRPLSWLETVQTALSKSRGGLSPRIRYQMPPDGFDGMGESVEGQDDELRNFLSKYLSSLASLPEGAAPESLSCEKVLSGSAKASEGSNL